MVLIPNPTRRTAVILVCLPVMALYLVYTFHLREFAPTMASWPTQQEIAVHFRTLLRHSLWPWTVKLDQDREFALERDEIEREREEHREEHQRGGDGRRLPFSRHIIAVGDLHGDLPNARKVLQFAGVVDKNGDWTGNADFFVQTGDIIDRGDDTILLFVWMERLRQQAAAVGGTVLSHLGNHEWMNAIGDWRYVYPSELKTFGSVAARQRMITTGRIGRAWATNYTVASRLPLHPSLGPPNTPYPSPQTGLQYQKEDNDASDYVLDDDETDPLSHAAVSFVHGGLSPSYSNLSPFPTKINDLGKSLLAKLQSRVQPPPHPPAAYPGLPDDTTAEEAELYGANGPLWYRGWAMENEAYVCSQVDEVLKKTGTRKMIMGHTPDFQNIKSRCNGKVIIIDTGISHAYGGALSALSIYYTMTPIGDDDSKMWREREIVTAVYAQRREVVSSSERIILGEFDHSKDKKP